MYTTIFHNKNTTALFKLNLNRNSRFYNGFLGVTDINYHVLCGKINTILSIEEMIFFNTISLKKTKESYLQSRYLAKLIVGRFINSRPLKSHNNL